MWLACGSSNGGCAISTLDFSLLVLAGIGVVMFIVALWAGRRARTLADEERAAHNPPAAR